MQQGDWEVRGLFGNEYALEKAVEQMRRLPHRPELTVIDRRNVQVVMQKDDEETRKLVKSIITIEHGWVESDGPLGAYEKKKADLKAKRLKQEREKRKKRVAGKH